jgi:hypothetical protein
MGMDDQERIECRASSASITQLHSAYDALRDQLKTLVITDSSDVSGTQLRLLYAYCKYQHCGGVHA